MFRAAALPGLTTVAALATAVVVVVHPIVPSLPDVQVPALFPTQVDVPAVVKAASGPAVLVAPSVRAAVQNVQPPAVLQQTVAEVATAVVPSPSVAALMHAARALTIGAAPAGSAPAPVSVARVPQASELAGTQQITRPVALTPFRIQAAAPNVPPPMASVPVGSVPVGSVPRAPQPDHAPSQRPTRGFGPGSDHSGVIRRANP